MVDEDKMSLHYILAANNVPKETRPVKAKTMNNLTIGTAKPIKCRSCPSTFKRKSALNKHVRCRWSCFLILPTNLVFVIHRSASYKISTYILFAWSVYMNSLGLIHSVVICKRCILNAANSHVRIVRHGLVLSSASPPTKETTTHIRPPIRYPIRHTSQLLCVNWGKAFQMNDRRNQAKIVTLWFYNKLVKGLYYAHACKR